MTKPTCQVEGCSRTTAPGMVICDDCAERLVRDLLAVPGLAAALEEAHRKGLRFSRTAMVPHPDPVEPESPVPFNPRASEALRELLRVLTLWADWIAKERGLHRPLDTAPTLARWLATQVTWLRSSVEGPAAAGAIRRVVRRGLLVVDAPPDLIYAGPCTAEREGERCGADLYAEPGKVDARCPVCGAVYPLAERREWLLAKAEDMLLPASELSRAIDGLGLDVTPEVIWKWHERGRLASHGTTRAGRPVFRVGDVRDLVLQAAKKKGRA